MTPARQAVEGLPRHRKMTTAKRGAMQPALASEPVFTTTVFVSLGQRRRMETQNPLQKGCFPVLQVVSAA